MYAIYDGVTRRRQTLTTMWKGSQRTVNAGSTHRGTAS